MKVGGICGNCRKYYRGDSCPECKPVDISDTLNVIMDIPEHFNRGLGEVVRGRADYRAKLREKGLVEVGNEKSHVDPERIRQTKEREQERKIVELRPAAYQMLSRYEGDYRWN